MRDVVYAAILTLRRRGFKVEAGNLVTDAMLIDAERNLSSQLPLPLDIPLQF